MACISLLFVVLFCCPDNYRFEKAEPTVGNSALGDPSADQPLGARMIQDQVLNSCALCHAAGKKPPILSSLDLIRANLPEVWSSVIAGRMPKDSSGIPKLSSCRLTLLKKWMDLGAPDETSFKVADFKECASLTPPPTVIPIEQMPLNYSVLVERILKPRKCIGCHDPTDPAETTGIYFAPYSEIAGSRHWKAPGATSNLVHFLTLTTKKRMPPPSDGDALPDAEVQYIIRWIDAGKPEL